MSDPFIYEFEDIVWDDFSISVDHIVPYPQIQQDERNAVQAESQKKFGHEARMISRTGSHGGESIGVATQKTLFSLPKITIDKVIANSSWYHKTNISQTYNYRMADLSSEGLTVTRGDFISNNSFNIGASNPINNCTAADNNIFCSLSDTPQLEIDLSFISNGLENKGIDDSLFYEWPEIANYDLNHMLKYNMSCDSAFRLQDMAKEDDSCWFSSSAAINGPDAASQSQVRSSYSDSNSLKIFSDNCESPQPNYESPTVDALKKRSAGACYTSSTLASNTAGQSCFGKASSVNELPTNSHKMDIGKPIKEVNVRTRNIDYQTQTMENNISLHHFDGSEATSKTQRSFSKGAHKLFSSNSSGLQNQNVVDVTYSGPISVQKKNSVYEESLNKNSHTNEHPLEETSFLQLQEVMEQMDLKTKLCIRDSLYRLARSAKQRHGIATMNRVGKVDKNSNEAMIAGTGQGVLLDIETDTNPTDRSIAHLLFHRPSDPSKMLFGNTRPGHNLNDGAELLGHGDFRSADYHAGK